MSIIYYYNTYTYFHFANFMYKSNTNYKSRLTTNYFISFIND